MRESEEEFLNSFCVKQIDKMARWADLLAHTDGAACPETMAHGTGFHVTDNNHKFLTEQALPGSSLGTSFEAETEAISRAVDHLLHCTSSEVPITGPHDKAVKHVAIFTDSQSVLQALRAPQKWPHQGIQQLRNKLWALTQSHGLKLKLVWIPSHVGIPGNERADSLAEARGASTL